MKKLAILLTILCLLAGCSSAKQTEGNTSTTTQGSGESSSQTQSTSTAAPVTFQVYVPNEALDGFTTSETVIPSLDPALILSALQNAGVVDPEVSVNSATVAGTQLNLDLTEAFYTQICSMGSSGEAMLMGSLVNTFLSAYGCEAMMVTVDGGIIHSGHVDYDFPMTPTA